MELIRNLINKKRRRVEQHSGVPIFDNALALEISDELAKLMEASEDAPAEDSVLSIDKWDRNLLTFINFLVGMSWERDGKEKIKNGQSPDAVMRECMYNCCLIMWVISLSHFEGEQSFPRISLTEMDISYTLSEELDYEEAEASLPASLSRAMRLAAQSAMDRTMTETYKMAGEALSEGNVSEMQRIMSGGDNGVDSISFRAVLTFYSMIERHNKTNLLGEIFSSLPLETDDDDDTRPTDT